MVTDSNFLDFLTTLRAFLATKPDPLTVRSSGRKRISCDVTITNLGRLNIPQQFGSLQLQKLYLTVTGLKTEPLIVGVATLGDQMCVTCRYLESVIPPAIAEEINQGARQRLGKAIG